LAFLLNDCLFRKSRFFNKVARVEWPVERDFDAAKRRGAVSYNLPE
jgi:hypothetical protein